MRRVPCLGSLLILAQAPGSDSVLRYSYCAPAPYPAPSGTWCAHQQALTPEQVQGKPQGSPQSKSMQRAALNRNAASGATPFSLAQSTRRFWALVVSYGALMLIGRTLGLICAGFWGTLGRGLANCGYNGAQLSSASTRCCRGCLGWPHGLTEPHGLILWFRPVPLMQVKLLSLDWGSPTAKQVADAPL